MQLSPAEAELGVDVSVGSARAGERKKQKRGGTVLLIGRCPKGKRVKHIFSESGRFRSSGDIRTILDPALNIPPARVSI